MKECMKKIPELFISCRSDKDVISVMEEYSYDPEVVGFGISELKEEENIMFVMKKIEHNKKVYKTGIPSLRKKENILFVMKTTDYDEEICNIGVPSLHLANKSDKEILLMIEESGNNHIFFKLVAPFLKKEKNIILVIRITEYDINICKSGMYLLSEESITLLKKESNCNFCVAYVAMQLSNTEEKEKRVEEEVE
jgi:hypothetical protein